MTISISPLHTASRIPARRRSASQRMRVRCSPCRTAALYMLPYLGSRVARINIVRSLLAQPLSRRSRAYSLLCGSGAVCHLAPRCSPLRRLVPSASATAHRRRAYQEHNRLPVPALPSSADLPSARAAVLGCGALRFCGRSHAPAAPFCRAPLPLSLLLSPYYTMDYCELLFMLLLRVAAPYRLSFYGVPHFSRRRISVTFLAAPAYPRTYACCTHCSRLCLPCWIILPTFTHHTQQLYRRTCNHYTTTTTPPTHLAPPGPVTAPHTCPTTTHAARRTAWPHHPHYKATRFPTTTAHLRTPRLPPPHYTLHHTIHDYHATTPFGGGRWWVLQLVVNS